MGLMTGKKGIIFGVSNTHGIAYAIAQQLFNEGADIAFTYAGEIMEKRVRPLAEGMNAKLIMSCDVIVESQIVCDELRRLDCQHAGQLATLQNYLNLAYMLGICQI